MSLYCYYLYFPYIVDVLPEKLGHHDLNEDTQQTYNNLEEN